MSVDHKIFLWSNFSSFKCCVKLCQTEKAFYTFAGLGVSSHHLDPWLVGWNSY